MYSASACMKECRMKKALQLCKCVPPFYASKSVSKSPKCWVTNLTCLKQNEKEITSNNGCQQCQLSCLTTVYESERFRKKYLGSIFDNFLQSENKITFQYRKVWIWQRHFGHERWLLHKHWVLNLADHQIQAGGLVRLGWSSGVVRRHCGTFLGVLAAVCAGNCLFFHNQSWMHVRNRTGIINLATANFFCKNFGK